jgi:hypothetical protein
MVSTLGIYNDDHCNVDQKLTGDSEPKSPSYKGFDLSNVEEENAK